MKNIIHIIAAAAAFCCSVAYSASGDGVVCSETIRQLHGTSVGSVPMRTGCQTVVIDGTNYVRETWRRGNFTWSNLQPERRIIGARIQNSAETQIQNLSEEISARMAELTSMSRRAERAEAFKVALRQRIEEHRDKAITSTAISFYKALLEVWDEIDEANNARFDGGGE